MGAIGRTMRLTLSGGSTNPLAIALPATTQAIFLQTHQQGLGVRIGYSSADVGDSLAQYFELPTGASIVIQNGLQDSAQIWVCGTDAVMDSILEVWIL